VLVPVFNEDPVATFARVAAMDASVAATGTDATVHFAILSDTRDEAVAAEERRWFLRLVQDRRAAGRIFYRRRTVNTGKKAGNIEEFIQRSGAAYDHALILDADSLMEGATIVEMVRRMEADPDLGPAAVLAARDQCALALWPDDAVLGQLLFAGLCPGTGDDAGPDGAVLGAQRDGAHPRLRSELRVAGTVRPAALRRAYPEP
jgi:hypothetical protein